ncbi:unnamed protein product [Tuber aestivum]|uniref:Uncharacterized protein n=1 Tax=Tuber aestivum TaxID=59557 RepID=A0A292PZB3_9PEZI|nr:unnamed protein product [Tuber aestivum]
MPDNLPEKEDFYFQDIEQRFGSAQLRRIEQTLGPDFAVAIGNIEKGVSIARAAEVNLRNNHMQNIITWYTPRLPQSGKRWVVLLIQF